jgi:hypothetical protein
VQTHAGQAVLEEARRIARQELATDDPSYASYDDNTTTTTTWPRDPGAVFNTTPDGNHVVVVTIKTPLTGGKPEDPKTTNDTPPASSQGPQSHPLPEEDEDHDGYSHNNDTTNMPVDDHVAAPATDTATRPATPEEATLSDAATAGATTASNDYTMPNGRPASPFLEASRRHQEDTTPAPLQTTTLEEALSETLPNSAFHIDDDPRGTAPAPAGESLAEEEATSCPPPAPTTADLPAGDAVAPEAPAASWGSGTMPSTRPSTTGEQQEETVQKIPDAKNATNACAAPESAPAAPATNAEAVATLTTPACVTKATPAITLDPAPSSTTTSGRSSCSSSEDVEVRADSNTPASQKTASRQQKAGVYIVPQRRYYDNMGDSWCFSGGRPGCSAAAAVVALLEMGLTPADEGLRQLAAAYTLPQLRQLAALRFYGSDAKVGGQGGVARGGEGAV